MGWLIKSHRYYPYQKNFQPSSSKQQKLQLTVTAFGKAGLGLVMVGAVATLKAGAVVLTGNSATPRFATDAGGARMPSIVILL